MERTLLEYYYALRIAALATDEDLSYGQRMVVIELLANQYGWKHLCDQAYLDHCLKGLNPTEH